MTAPAATLYRLNRLRYLHIVFFFGYLALQIIWWYLFVQPITGRAFVRRGEKRRFRRWARQFRNLAVRLGGVMIKLGQFVSSRSDILPPEITGELADLQDEVPPVPFDQMARTLHEQLGPDWRSRFSTLDTDTVAAASLGQVYRGALAENGDRVAIKVQRPGIANVVYTDLSALEVVVHFAMRFRYIRRRANLPLLLEEFARVLWEELDYTKEAANAERFAALFKDDMGVYIPSVYHAHSTRSVLVLEDVTAIKLNDYAAIAAAGVDRREAAQRLLDTYLTMVFVHRFFHADPHAGNIFLYPLPLKEAPRHKSHPFYLIFVDFGMTAELTPPLVAGLRETLIALITRDSERLVRGYQQLGILLPEADLDRIKQANEAAFEQVYGLSMSEMAGMDPAVMHRLMRDFSDLLLDLPFQLPQEFVYLGRAVGILSGMCTGLDPAFDPWKQIQPFVGRLLLENNETETAQSGESTWSLPLDWKTLRGLITPKTATLALTTGRDLLSQVIALPARADNALSRLERGEIKVQVQPTRQLEERLDRLARAERQIAAAVVFSGLAVASALLYLGGEPAMGTAGAIAAGFTLVVGFLRGRSPG